MNGSNGKLDGGNSQKNIGITFKSEKWDYGVNLMASVNKGFCGVIDVPETYNGEPVTAVGFVTDKNLPITQVNLSKYIRAFIMDSEQGFHRNLVITIDPENPFLICKDNIIYTKDRSCLVKFLKLGSERFVVPRGVKRIFRYAFKKIGSLKEVVLPPETVFIENEAFSYCGSLEKINLENVKYLGESAFESCDKLDNIHLTCAEIPEETFRECSSLCGVLLENTKIIRAYAFENCSSLDHLKLPEGLEKIDHKAFFNTCLDSMKLPKSLIELGGDVCSYCKEIEVYLTKPFPLDFNLDLCLNLRLGCRITVRSPQTEEILFRIVIFELEKHPSWIRYTYLQSSGVDFEGYDKCFRNNKTSWKDTFGIQINYEKYRAAKYRLKYPVGLTKDMRSYYKRYLKEHVGDVLKYYVKFNETQKILKFDHCRDIPAPDFSEIIKLAAEKNDPELTAILLQKRHG